MLSRSRVLIPLLILLACARERRAVEVFRGELALLPVRHGLAIDVPAIQRELDRLADTGRNDLATRFTDGLRLLPKRSVPAAPEVGPIVNLRAHGLAPIGDIMADEYLIDPDPGRLALERALLVLPTQISASIGLAARHAAAWESFLRMARPVACDCGHDDREATICLDYGGLDVFVV